METSKINQVAPGPDRENLAATVRADYVWLGAFEGAAVGVLLGSRLSGAAWAGNILPVAVVVIVSILADQWMVRQYSRSLSPALHSAAVNAKLKIQWVMLAFLTTITWVIGVL